MGWAKNKVFTAYFVKCQSCGELFKTVPTSSKQKTCSRKCAMDLIRSRRKTGECEICKTPIFHTPKRTRRFCSNKCKGIILKELGKKISEARSNWGQWKNKKSAKQWFVKNYTGCQKCGFNRVLEILELHHIDRNGRNNTRENLMLLCPNCHSEDHWINKDGQFANNRGQNAIKFQGIKNKKKT